MSSARRILLGLLLLLACVVHAAGGPQDDIWLQGGARLTGLIESEDERLLQLRLASGELQILDRRLISDIRYAEGLDWSLVASHLHQRRWEAAAQLLQRCIEELDHPGRPRLFRCLAHCRSALGAHDQTIATLILGLHRHGGWQGELLRGWIPQADLPWSAAQDEALATALAHHQAGTAPGLAVWAWEAAEAAGDARRADRVAQLHRLDADPRLEGLRRLHRARRAVQAGRLDEADQLLARADPAWPIRRGLVEAELATARGDGDAAVLARLRIGLDDSVATDLRCRCLTAAATALTARGHDAEALAVWAGLRRHFPDHPESRRALRALATSDESAAP